MIQCFKTATKTLLIKLVKCVCKNVFIQYYLLSPGCYHFKYAFYNIWRVSTKRASSQNIVDLLEINTFISLRHYWHTTINSFVQKHKRTEKDFSFMWWMEFFRGTCNLNAKIFHWLKTVHRLCVPILWNHNNTTHVVYSPPKFSYSVFVLLFSFVNIVNINECIGGWNSGRHHICYYIQHSWMYFTQK